MGKIGCAKTELRDFLVTRRARITPAMAGLPTYGTNRRVEGLRREEVALLAGISAEYYIRLERGNATGASPSVIRSVSDALQLNDVERDHFAHLVEAIVADKGGSRRATKPVASGEPSTLASNRATVPAPRPGLQFLIDSIPLPTFVFNRTMDVVAANRMGRLLYAPMFDYGGTQPNAAMFAFLGGAPAREFWPNLEQLFDDAVAELRAESGRDPYAPALVQLIGTLSTQSEEFRTRWASHNVKKHQAGTKTMRHPIVGTLTMPYEKFVVMGDEDLFVQTYTVQPGSPADDSLQVLSSWTAEDATAPRPPSKTRSENQP